MRRIARAAAVLALVGLAAPASADIVRSDEDGFLTRDEAVVDASPKEVWLALISPARWWKSAHTWSGDAANMRLTPQAGGCFCETIPEVDDPDRFTLEGSVEHMRVIQAYPERALVMRGALGPLQTEPVAGVLTIAISEVDGGTRIVWTYNVGGRMRYEVPVIARAVDGIMGEQLGGLADLLGLVKAPSPRPGEGGAGPVIDPAPVIDGRADDDTSARGPTVEEAFGDLSDDS